MDQSEKGQRKKSKKKKGQEEEGPYGIRNLSMTKEGTTGK